MSMVDSGLLAGLTSNPFSPSQLNPLAWYDVHLAGTPGQTIADQMGGTAATLGSAAGVDANDPTWLQRQSLDYLWSAVNSNRMNAGGGAASIDMTGDISLRVRVNAPFSTLSTGELIGDRSGSTGEGCFQIFSTTTLRLFWFESGVAKQAVSTAHGITDNTDVWLRADRENNVSGAFRVTFYRSTDNVATSAAVTTWTQFSQITGAAVAAPTLSSQAWMVPGLTAFLAGKIYRAEAWQFAGSTPLFVFDAAKSVHTGYTDTEGSISTTWTATRSTSGKKLTLVKTYGTLLFATNSLVQIPAAAITSFGTATTGTVTVVGRMWPTPLSNGRWFDNRGSATETVAGVGIRQNGTAASLVGTMGDGTNTAATAAVSYTAGQQVVASLIVDATTFKLRVNGVESASVARPAGSATGTLGLLASATTAAASPAEGTFRGAVFCNRALSAGEASALESYYGANSS